MDDFHYRSAVGLSAAIREGQLSARELMEATLTRIDVVDRHVNAIPTMVPERALAAAAAADEAIVHGQPLGPLHGLPIAHKDLLATEGIRTTMGSPILSDWVPDHDDLIVGRLRAAGAICVGKTNTPEFGAGSQTFNRVFGPTRNPYDLSMTCGGSSGGAAVALATGMLSIADGSDTGGSLRNPASFCNVVGLRPTVGRVPRLQQPPPWKTLSVTGPMARSVADVALLFAAMAGPDEGDPHSLPEPGSHFAPPLDRPPGNLRVAFSPTLGGLPVDRRVAAVVADQPAIFEGLGAAVEEVELDLTSADDIFQTLRAWAYNAQLGGYYDDRREELKDSVRWNIERGRALTEDDLQRARHLRRRLADEMDRLMSRYHVLIAPVSQVPPFPIEQEWVREIEGTPMTTYIEWMQSCCVISATGLPAISVPAGFTEEGHPVGLQVVGRPCGERELLAIAHAYEQVRRVGDRRPPESTWTP